jgi:type IV fimbrial biogenesis protein FimT
VRHLKRQRGLTLIELLVAMVIGGVLLVAAAPSFQEYRLNSRLRENGNALYSQTLLAQSEAIKRNATVRVAIDDGVIQVQDISDPDTPVLIRELAFTGGVSTDDASIDFGGEGRPLDFNAASVNLSKSGHDCSTEVRCPGLRVDAGGAIRLCGDQTNCPT